MTPDLKSFRDTIEDALTHHLPVQSDIAQVLVDAMRYASLSGGKRIRPLLVCATCTGLGGALEDALAPACAVEFIHAYSLLHDDLPAMDDDDLRHGLPSGHIKFGEANAILAGDALHTLAFHNPDGIVSVNPTGNPGMATGGMGDVLGGMIAALLASGLIRSKPPERASIFTDSPVTWCGTRRATSASARATLPR